MKKTTLIWFFVIVLVTYGVIRVFAHLYDSTQKLRAASYIDRYADINMNIVGPVSKVLETFAMDSPKELSQSEKKQREERVETLSKQFPKAHAFYNEQCVSCHGPIGQGGKALSFLGTHMNHVNGGEIAYIVPPLRLGEEWTFHLDSPHLPPTGIDRLSLEDFMALKQYLRTLVK